MGILTSIEKRLPIPKEAEWFFNDCHGDLICSKCGAIIIADKSEDLSPWMINHIASLVAAHHCEGIKFKYDFNDPRTLKQQLEAQKKLGGLF